MIIVHTNCVAPLRYYPWVGNVGYYLNTQVQSIHWPKKCIAFFGASQSIYWLAPQSIDVLRFGLVESGVLLQHKSPVHLLAQNIHCIAIFGVRQSIYWLTAQSFDVLRFGLVSLEYYSSKVAQSIYWAHKFSALLSWLSYSSFTV